MSGRCPSREFVTADQHHGHDKLIPFCERPFKDIYEMDQVMIRRWNLVVKPDDFVWVVGDFSFYSDVVTSRILQDLNGSKGLILGNHDKSRGWARRVGFAAAVDSLVLGDALLIHDPMDAIEAEQGIVLHGHIHNKAHRPMPEKDGKRFCNVGVDVRNFTPMLLAKAKREAR
jgi:calcineurin-like phosphoesterase family protein